MQISITACTVVKWGNKRIENDDALWPNRPKGSFRVDGGFSCALADGATQTSFASLWARLLTRLFVRRVPTPDQFVETVSIAQEHWQRLISKCDLPWHAEEKVRRGAYATLLWLQLQDPVREDVDCGTWEVMAVGDSCIYHWRNSELVTHYPIKMASEFTNTPMMLSSHPMRNAEVFSSINELRFTGEWQTGDEFVLATDALAAWFHQRAEESANPLQILKGAVLDQQDCQAAFMHWVDQLRTERAIKNDDTTMIWIRLGG